MKMWQQGPAWSATGLTLVHGLGQSAEVAMRFSLVYFKKNTNSQLFFVNSIAKFGNLSFQQQIPLELMVTDCSFGTKTLLESLRIRIFFGPKLSFQIIQFKKRVALMLIESRTK